MSFQYKIMLLLNLFVLNIFQNFVLCANENLSHFNPIRTECGFRSGHQGRIVGGYKVNKIAKWPWIGAIGFINVPYEDVQWLCGSTLISERFVLTAAHCLSPSPPIPVAVYFGSTTLSNNIIRKVDKNYYYEDGSIKYENKIGIIADIEAYYVHEHYDPKILKNDIALIKLRNSLPASTDNIRPICLPISIALLKMGEDVSVAGWGRRSFSKNILVWTTLYETQINILDNEECLEKFHTAEVNICAGRTDEISGPCMGDSGGPLMYCKNPPCAIVGIVSGGGKCYEDGAEPAIFTNVTKYISWIINTAEYLGY